MARCAVLTCDNDRPKYGHICSECGASWVNNDFQTGWVEFLLKFDPQYEEMGKILTAYIDLQFEAKD